MTDTTHITKEGLDIAAWVSVQPEFSAIESPLILRIIEAAFARAAELEQSQPAQISHHEDCWRDPKHHACAVAKIAEVERLNTHAERLSRINREVLAESEPMVRWLLEQESEGVILYYRRTAFTHMPTRDANEANHYLSETFAVFTD